ncbi:MAG TPA: hypothetical protein DIT04_11410, partial [Dysgonomonas sp.]|nr:hypothetical protein [Dysgonomonas sp.]
RIKIKTKPAEVCEMMVCEAIYLEGGEPTVNENIQWEVMVYSGKMKKDEDGNEIEESKTYKLVDVKLEKSTLGKLEGKPLSDKKDANPEEVFKIKGNKICFNVPKEWGQKEVRFMASLNEGEEDLLAISQKIKVKDHIVAAFFRINPNEAKQRTIQGIEGGEKNYKNLIGPVHHHQGMYRTGDRYFISGSTDKDTPSYTYMIDEKENGNHIHKKSVLFNEGVLKYYRHAGGMQIAKGLMAIGIEEYNYGLLGLFGSAVHQRSVVCFFDAEKGTEFKKLRIIKDDEYKNKIKKLRNEYKDKDKSLTEKKLDDLVKSDNKYSLLESSDYASAVGIVYKENLYSENLDEEELDKKKSGKYYVVSRGGKQGVRFYEISEDKESINAISTIEEPFVGEFQNVNLHLNECGEIYMFGMGKSQMGGVDTCKIYQVNILQGRAMISSVWINESGEIELTYYRYENEKNKLVFTCENDTSFHWASCIHMENRNLIGNNKGLSTDLIGQSFEQGFQGKFTIYTINKETIYYHIREDLARRDYLREGSPGNFYNYKQQDKYRIPLTPQLRCYCFTEDDFKGDTK